MTKSSRVVANSVRDSTCLEFSAHRSRKENTIAAMDYTILHKRFFNYRLAFLLSLLRSLVLLVLFFFLVCKVIRGKTKTHCLLTSLSEETEEALVLYSAQERQSTAYYVQPA